MSRAILFVKMCFLITFSLVFISSNLAFADEIEFKKECYKILPGTMGETLPDEVQNVISALPYSPTIELVHSDGRVFVILSLGMQSSDGFGVDVKKILVENNLVTLQVVETKPGKDSARHKVMTFPRRVISFEDPEMKVERIGVVVTNSEEE